MSDLEALVDGVRVTAAEGWTLELDDPDAGAGRLVSGEVSVPVVVEGSGTDWTVSLRGRRIPVEVRSWRERLLAEAEVASGAAAGPGAVKATLPGLIVAIRVAVGDDVEEGQPLLTIEAMKMQNEVRAPRSGRVAAVAVAEGQAVSTGATLVTFE